MVRNNAKIFLSLVLFALLIRIVLLAFSPGPPVLRYFNFDEADYELLGKNLYEGNGYCYVPGEPSAFRPPLYPIFVAAVFTLSGERNHRAIQWFQAIVSAVCAGLLYSLGSLIFGPRAGIFAGLLFSIYPTMLYYVPKLLTETLFITLLTGAMLLLFVAVRRDNVAFYALAGGMFGVAFLCRTVLLPFLVLFFIPMMLILAKRRVVKRITPRIAAFYLVFLAAISPWIIRNYVVFSEFIPTDTHLGWVLWHNTKVHFDFDSDFEKSEREIAEARDSGTLSSESFFDAIQRYAHFGVQAQQDGIRKAYNPTVMPQTETEISEFFTEKSLAFFRENKLLLVRDRVANFINFWMPISSIEGRKGEYFYTYGVIAIFAAIGLWLALKSRPIGDWLPLLAIVANFWLATTLFIYHSRLKMPADIATLIFAGFAMDTIAREKGWAKLSLIAAGAIALNLILGSVLLPLKELVKAVL
ncbi:MAG: glycosyltransferase family 39 protein [Candidatus Coatesbacteria bacterium]|nr:glycosyltransferase family 39 protein [Candidatus Coatesbacteria bacterium]